MQLIINQNEPSSGKRTAYFWLGSGITGLTFSASHLQVSKNGGAEANSAGSVSELGGGVYKYVAAISELDTEGSVCVRHNRIGVVAEPIFIQVASVSGLSVNTVAIGGAAASGVNVVNANIVSWSGQSLPQPRNSGVPLVNVEYIHGIAASGTGIPDVNVVSWSGQSIAAPDIAGFPKVTLSNGTGAGQISLTNGFVSVTGVSDKSGYTITNAASTGIAQAVWNSLRANHTLVGSYGESISAVQNVGAVTGRLTFSVNASGIDSSAKTGFSLATSQNYNNAGTVTTVTNITNPVIASSVTDRSNFRLSSTGVMDVWSAQRSTNNTAGSFGESVAGVAGNVAGSVGSVVNVSNITSANKSEDYDGVTFETLMEMIKSYLSGKVSISDLGSNRTIVYYGADGTTEKFRITASKNDGSRSAGGTIS